MALTPDWDNRIIDSSSSITDLVTFHQDLRALEASTTGMLFPPIHTFRALDVGGGGYFYSVDFINGWKLRFPVAGNYTITGNINAEVVGVAGVFVFQTKSLAFATTSAAGSGGGTGSAPSADDVANAVWSHPFASTLLTVKKFLGLS
jgi:hypothetical protein